MPHLATLIVFSVVLGAVIGAVQHIRKKGSCACCPHKRAGKCQGSCSALKSFKEQLPQSEVSGE